MAVGTVRHSRAVIVCRPAAREWWYISIQTPPARASAGMTPRQVVDFFLTDRSFPRSIAFSLHEFDSLLWGLQRHGNLTRVRDVRQAINPVLEQVALPSNQGGVEHRLNAHIDHLQVCLDDLAGRIATTFFR